MIGAGRTMQSRSMGPEAENLHAQAPHIPQISVQEDEAMLGRGGNGSQQAVDDGCQKLSVRSAIWSTCKVRYLRKLRFTALGHFAQ